MKNLFVLALALVMTCTFAFAQSPYSKGESVGKEIAKSAIAEDEENFFEYFEAFFEDIMEYASNDSVSGTDDGTDAFIDGMPNPDYGKFIENVEHFLIFIKFFFDRIYFSCIVRIIFDFAF